MGRTKETREPCTELRDYGDGRTIVLYTEDNEVYQKLKKSAEREVFYETWKNCDPTKASKVAVDLYFPRKKKEAINKRVLRTRNFTKSTRRKEKVEQDIKPHVRP